MNSLSVSLVADIWQGAAGSDPIPLLGLNNRLLFSADDGVHGRELYMTSPVTRISDMNPGTGSSNPTLLGQIGNTVFLCADDGVNGRVLWSTTGGTPSLVSTVRVDDAQAVVAGGILFFAGDDGASGTELWKSNGSPGGTVRVRDITPGSGGTDIFSLTAIQATVYFVGRPSNSFNSDLYISDGSSGGTFALPIRPGGSSDPIGLKVVATTLLFAATDGTHGRELWRANGASFSMVADILPGASGSSPDTQSAVSLGTQLLFWGERWRPRKRALDLQHDHRSGAAVLGPGTRRFGNRCHDGNRRFQ